MTSTVRALLLLVGLLSACTSDAGSPSTTSTAPVVSSTESTTATTDTTTEPSTPSVVEPAPIQGSFTPVIVATFPHDSTSYTQGLEILDGQLLESAGRYGESDRRLVDISTGSILDREALPDDVFAEGLTVVGSEIVQLTWRAETVFRSNVDSLDVIATQSYRGEGWGICNDGTQLVMSNGSAELTFRDPTTFEPTRTVSVTRNDGTPVSLLNELECIAGQVWANVYRSDEIVVIDPASGRVAATIDASSLRPTDLPIDDADFALNGIAHDPETGQLYLTGKLWPVLYEVELEPS